jgi:hypothetical protein
MSKYGIKYPTIIASGGHISQTVSFTPDKQIIGGDTFSTGDMLNNAEWTESTLYSISLLGASQQGDCIASYGAGTRANLNAYAYVLSWTNTSVTIRIVAHDGWMIHCFANVIG